MTITLRLQADLAPSRFAALSRDLQSTLNQLGDIEASHAVRRPRPSERSAELNLFGQVLLSFVGAGALKALVQCLQAYISREPSLEYELARGDGRVVKLTAKNFTPEHIDQMVATLREFAS